ncbi:hypothetical protein BDF21DRAFT_432191 [Thamnidium elegans]|nr:hypothetical protein BDF21DRAFT_432191 [Thamnidium elegans]
MQIRVLGVPQTGAKSRVETQIKLCIQLVTDDGDKAQWWSHLKLPEHMVAKDKLKRQVLLSTAPNGTKIANVAGLDNPTIKPEKMLFLTARVICASDPSRKVVTCLGCIQRERKRSQRRKENKVKNENDDVCMDDDKSLANEEQKVLLFNCSEVVDFSSGDTILPTRITCYCRHHNERLGFCIYFEMHDHNGKQVATGMSPPIMITDDHKSNKMKAGRKRLRTDIEKPITNTSPFDTRQQHHLSSAGPLIPQPRPPHQSQNFQNKYQIQPRPSMIDSRSSPITPLDSPMTHTSPFMTDRAISPAPVSVSSSTTTTHLERPLLQRLIPNEGPTFGGVEVTILGSGFRAGLTCMFGDVAASSTHYWSPNTLVCILPPAAEAGTVVVSFKEHPLVVDSQDVTLFTYYNENDRALMELALQVVGLKMTGKVEDARDIAMRIVQGGSGAADLSSKQQQGTHGGGGSNNNQMSLERHIIQVLEVMSTFRDVESCDVSITSAQGHTMLHLAAMLGFESLTRSLIQLGCDVNLTDKNGFTALHYCCWFHHENVVNVLLDEGLADAEISNMWNKKPMHLTDSTAIQNKIWDHVSNIESENESHGYSSSDRMSADIDTSYAEDDDDMDSVWLSETESVDNNATSWRHSYLSDSEESSSADETPTYEGMRHRRRQQLITMVPHQPNQTIPIQYLNQEESTSHSADEIMDAEPLFEPEKETDYEDNDHEPKEMNWMQRTLSHFQQPTTDSFLQNIKNNIPAKPADLNLKNIADHLLQFPRPATMIANMSVLFSQENTDKNQEEPAEQTLAWYMALAYAMGARSLNEEEENGSVKEEFHTPVYSNTSSAPVGQEIEAKKRRDKRLFSFWVPMLCLMVIWLIYQFLSSHPGVVDTVIGISGFRRQYLTIH